ncbi:monocyte to macrophage differentiation factor isoform X1 [Coccinella septempunctata]|uniref:monocyte to macrophage differentiation factor isoform X1 n=1 Tax=Coccinella septempunctata TaxID=41139 RepID=UPI001D07C113|nr:monocyte to macrophage differentiation factor isoform X1 [Coccinella septempunctata]XP_044758451.1 monocyte to macrophage differentiation factor isoform X1 [Coccinella septempunctata]XP_044758452.1 monocyte to macrophage differentiation factor isoform X1 [Coccinella septempunctata]
MFQNLDVKQIFFYRVNNETVTVENCEKTKPRINWKNPRAPPNQAYLPTYIEQIANVITHAIWVLPSVIATRELFQRSQSEAQSLSALIYGSTLIFLFVVSTSFHYVFFYKKDRYLVNFLHRCDRAVIYIFIAGSYFPWLTIHALKTNLASGMKMYVWILALLGIIYQQVFHEKYKTLEIVLYLAMGVVPATAICMAETLPAIEELTLGGVLYITGVIFFKCDGIIPFAHAIWHMFVAFAAMTHYYAILIYLFPIKENLDIEVL